VVVRRALGSLLPDSVRRRDDKAEFSSTFVETLEALGGRAFFTGLRCAEAGWVDGGVAQRMYDDMISDYASGRDSYCRGASALWSVAAVELWMKQQEERANGAIDTSETRTGTRPAAIAERHEATV
jgi:hypothetical protein